MPKYIFLDTMVYLHYKPIVELNLNRFDKDCVLVVPRVTLGELNKHKDSHKSNAIQKRARSICNSIASWSETKTVSDKLGFEFVIHTPNPEEHGLDKTSNDDILLANIIEYPKAIEDKVLITNDTNMLLTAKHLGIIAEEIDESLMLPSIIHPIEEENRRLKREIDQLKNAHPKLEIGIIYAENNVTANPIFPIDYEVLSDNEIEEMILNLKTYTKEHYMSTQPSESFLDMVLPISKERISAYHKKLDNYITEYEKYLVELQKYQNKPKFRFIIGIANKGNTPACNVDIELHFPDGFELYEEDDCPQAPIEPTLPSKPLSATENLFQSTQLGIANLALMTEPKLSTFSSFSLKKTNSYDVCDHFSSIKHNTIGCINEIFLIFNNYESIKPFKCRYSIKVDNLPNEINGDINFQFQKPENTSPKA